VLKFNMFRSLRKSHCVSRSAPQASDGPSGASTWN